MEKVNNMKEQTGDINREMKTLKGDARNQNHDSKNEECLFWAHELTEQG